MALQDRLTASAALAAAQVELHKRRQQRRQERIAQQLPIHTDVHGRLAIPRKSKALKPPRYSYPSLYWQSEPLSRNLRVWRELRSKQMAQEEARALSWLERPQASRILTASGTPAKRVSAEISPTSTFTLYPDLALAMLQQECAAAGRVWLLLRLIDADGCGWVSVDRARALLTGQHSTLRICGWRQLRNLLAQGDGIFWERDDHRSPTPRIWLRATAKVAAILDIHRIRTKAVSMPVKALLGGIGAVRAHFYASYHSGRDSESPIARQTLTQVTGVPRRSQRVYEKRAGINSQHNWAVGNRHGQQEVQQRAAQQGHAVFQLEDRQAKFGAAGKCYVAWQMPNSYVGPHAPQAKTTKKRINRQLADLLNEGMTGNGEQQVKEPESDDKGSLPRYFEHGRAASRAYKQHTAHDLYWRTVQAYRRYKIWHVLPGQESQQR